MLVIGAKTEGAILSGFYLFHLLDSDLVDTSTEVSDANETYCSHMMNEGNLEE